MKKYLLISLIFCLIFAPTIFAANSSSNEQGLEPPLIIDLNLAKLHESIKPYLKSLQESQAGGSVLEEGLTDSVTPKAPAPPLTYLQVYAVRSSQHPAYEYLSESQISTSTDHGGSFMHVVTIELGYGYNRITKMSGSTVPLLQSDPLDLDGDRIVDGYICYWDCSGYNSGQFTYQNTSTNSPWNTMSDWINIR